MNEKQKTLVIYLRISREDEQAGESDSIKNQRELIGAYLQARPELCRFEQVEISDDGFSGTSFDRPGMNRLLAMARKGEVACVIVKDFSRFGRNYIEAGNYLEQVFPFLGIRFISVNNHFDSAGHQSASGGLELAFQNLIHDYYSKDLSLKVKSARQLQMRQGKYTSPFAIFGYQKSAREKSRLLPDEPAARIVRQIFALACDGESTTAIARALNAADLPTPAAYKRQTGCGRAWEGSSPEAFWTRDAVTRILRDARYTGQMVCGKRERLLGKHATKKIPRSGWRVVEDTHEAIVTQEVFDRAQDCMAELREQDKRPRKNQNRQLCGRVSCARCGHMMRRKESSRPYYYCETGRYSAAAGCGDARVEQETIEQLLRAVLQKQMAAAVSPDKILARRRALAEQAAAAQKQAIQKRVRQREQLKRAKMALYQALHAKRLTTAEYIRQRDENNRRQAELKGELETLEKDLARLCGVPDQAKDDPARLLEAFPPELGGALVEAVRIIDAGCVEIVLRYRDCFAQAVG